MRPVIINPTALSWVFNYRRLRIARAQPLARRNQVDIARLTRLVEEDGHSMGSLAWTESQSRKIDECGWEAWLASPDAQRGYKV